MDHATRGAPWRKLYPRNTTTCGAIRMLELRRFVRFKGKPLSTQKRETNTTYVLRQQTAASVTWGVPIVGSTVVHTAAPFQRDTGEIRAKHRKNFRLWTSTLSKSEGKMRQLTSTLSTLKISKYLQKRMEEFSIEEMRVKWIVNEKYLWENRLYNHLITKLRAIKTREHWVTRQRATAHNKKPVGVDRQDLTQRWVRAIS